MEDIELRLARKRQFSEFLEWEDRDGWSLKAQVEQTLQQRKGEAVTEIKTARCVGLYAIYTPGMGRTRGRVCRGRGAFAALSLSPRQLDFRARSSSLQNRCRQPFQISPHLELLQGDNRCLGLS